MAAFTVLGASGFVGSALASQLESDAHEVTRVSRSNWPRGGAVLGHVVFAIGLTADFRNRPIETAEAHVGVLLDALRNYQYDSFLYLSTTRVYRGADRAEETARLSVDPADPDDVYNATKIAGEAVCLSLPARTVRVARLSNVVGPGDASENFLSSIVREAAQSRAVTIRSAPESEKDYVAIDDVTKILAAIALRGQQRIYNVASGANVTHREVADVVRRRLGAEVGFAKDAPRATFPIISVERIKRELGATMMSFEEALSRVTRGHERGPE